MIYDEANTPNHNELNAISIIMQKKEKVYWKKGKNIIYCLDTE